MAVLAVVVAVAAVIAVVSTRDDDTQVDTGASSPALDGGSEGAGGTVTPGQPVVTAPVTVEGTALAAYADGGADPAVGRPFPDLSGVAVPDGSALAISADGRPKLVVFLAHWCPHCQAEVPRLQGWIDGGGVPAGVDLYAVSTGVSSQRGNFPPAEWLEEEGWTVPTLADSANMDAARAAGLSGYPFFVAVDGEGRIVERASGEQSISDVEELVDRLAG